MKRRIVALVAVLLISVGFTPSTSASSGVCFHECNIAESNVCIFTNSCYHKCWTLTGGCISTVVADCLDRCAF